MSRSRRSRAASAVAGLTCTWLPLACRTTPVSATVHEQESGTARVVIVGDVMLGRGVDAVVERRPESVFELLRPVLADADIAIGNLESPLTERRHVVGDHALEARPAASAALLAGAGFDAMAIANNHAGDAGPGTIGDTRAALDAVGIASFGAGEDLAAAWEPWMVEREGVRIAFLAIDASGGPAARAGPGVASWDGEAARRAVDAARGAADVVVVGLHAGVEYLPRPDPVLREIVADLSSWGADVVWGSGAHLRYDVAVADTSRGASLQAPGLGNALFDQRLPGTDEGAVLEVIVGSSGLVAHRVGALDAHLRSRFLSWDPPVADAVALGGDWWSAAETVAVATAGRPAPVAGLFGDAVPTAVAVGDVTGDGIADTVVAYRRPARPRVLHRAFPTTDFVDDEGRTAHVAVFDGSDGTLRWGAGTLLAPIAGLAVCDGAIALGFSTLRSDVVTAGGAWSWQGDGFSTSAVLPGAATLGCADVDRDGRTDPVLVRTSPEVNGG